MQTPDGETEVGFGVHAHINWIVHWEIPTMDNHPLHWLERAQFISHLSWYTPNWTYVAHPCSITSCPASLMYDLWFTSCTIWEHGLIRFLYIAWKLLEFHSYHSVFIPLTWDRSGCLILIQVGFHYHLFFCRETCMSGGVALLLLCLMECCSYMETGPIFQAHTFSKCVPGNLGISWVVILLLKILPIMGKAICWVFNTRMLPGCYNLTIMILSIVAVICR